MVHELEEAVVPTGLHYEVLGIGVREVDHRNPREQGRGLAWFQKEKLVQCWLRQNNHGSCSLVTMKKEKQNRVRF